MPRTPPTPDHDIDAAALARFGRLRNAEMVLLRACLTGEIAKVSLRLPESPAADVTVRAAFIAFILRGGVTLRSRRLQIVGAFIEGRLDLAGANVDAGLWFYRCRFDGAVVLEDARIAGAVRLAGCHLRALLADGCTIHRELALSAGCTVTHEVRLVHATIGGDLDFAQLDLSGPSDAVPSRDALMAEAVQVGGSVRLAPQFRAVGDVHFTAARVRGDFHAAGRFNGCVRLGGRRGAALVLDRACIGGAVMFNGGFGAAGAVSLRRARIDGDFDATGASFDWLGDAAWVPGASLVLEHARIGGALVLRNLQAPLSGATLADARAHTLCDDNGTWGEKLVLDGFVYRRFGPGAPLDAPMRQRWLEGQEPAHLRLQFRPQPWRRAARVLRRMGHEHAAGTLQMRREHWMRRSGAVGTWAPLALRWLPLAGHGLVGVLAGHGHRPGRVLAWLAGTWLASAAAYAVLAPQGGIDPLLYSLDRLWPMLQLHRPVDWAAVASGGLLPRALGAVESAFGALATLLLVASIAGWLDRDRYA